MKKINTITIESEAMAEMREGLNNALGNAISKMTGTGENKATVTLKIKISTEKKTVFGNDGEREVISPTIEHDITYAVQIKDKSSGSMGGADYELVYNKQKDCWETRPVSQQMDMLEELEDDEEDEDE